MHKLTKDFWQERILPWEHRRYSILTLLLPWTWPLRSRLNLAAKILRPLCKHPIKLLELGCGSGLLAAKLEDLPIEYTGFDIAENAITKAKKSYFAQSLKFDFKTIDITSGVLPKADITVFLGLVDWLNNAQLEHLFERISSDIIVFSYTESRSSLESGLYRAYRKHHDKHRDPACRARSYASEYIAQSLQKNNFLMRQTYKIHSGSPGYLVVGKRKSES